MSLLRMLLLPLLLLLSLRPLASVDSAPGEAVASVPAEQRVVVPETLAELALPLPTAATGALRRQAWTEADRALAAVDTRALLGAQQVDLAFLRAWVLVHAGRAEEAGKWLSHFEMGGTAPVPYRMLVRGEVLRARGDLLEALTALEAVGQDARIATRAAVQRAEVLHELGRTAASKEAYEALLAREDDADGAALVLMAVARRRGLGSEEARPVLERLWRDHPGTPEAREAATALQRYPNWTPSDADVVRRASRWMALNSYDNALEALEPVWDRVVSGSDKAAACEARYVAGRCHYKRNRLSEAVAAFGDGGERCVGVEGGSGHLMLYIVGQAEQRRGRPTESARSYTLISRLYPGTSFADDGLLNAGIALFDAGQLDQAKAAWRDALERYPKGDTAPESTWRLALALYDGGDGAAAREVAQRLGALDPALDRVHVRAGAYWAARWALYPDVEDPRRAVPSVNAHEAAVAGWRALIEQEPRDVYAILAWSRLAELAPDVAAELAVRRPPPEPAPGWDVRASFLADTGVGYGVALARLGLVKEAAAEWARAEVDARAEPAEMAWLISLRYAAGDGLAAHKTMHWWLRSRPLWTIPVQADEVIRVAYPNTWWREVQAAAAPYSFPPRFQHALIREESSFDPQAVSHVGARGLGQIMPGTAKETAGWLKRTIDLDDLFEPVTNLELGARYLHSVYNQVGRNPYLALAGYNAGPGRVKQWREAWSDPPIDEYIERIPYRETRDYVKKVMTTWQVYSYSYDQDAEPFPDLSAFNHRVSGG